MRVAIKGFFLYSAISGFLLTTGLFRFLIRPAALKRSVTLALTQFWSSVALFILGIRVRKDYDALPAFDRNYLIVCNHLSYLDVLILYSIIPSVFVTSVEVEQSSFLGLMCKTAGCLFVERRDRLSIRDQIEKVQSVLRDGVNVVVFPEGTSSPGKEVLPFKKSLLAAAEGTHVEVLPLCLNYRKIDGRPVSTQDVDCLFWYGDHTSSLIWFRYCDITELMSQFLFWSQ